MSNILIFGGGHVSQGIQRALHDTHHEVHCITSDTIDYTDFAAIRDYIVKKIYPDIVINTVAFTDVPGAELEAKKELRQQQREEIKILIQTQKLNFNPYRFGNFLIYLIENGAKLIH